MRRQQSQHKSSGETDEHDSPTDPMMPIFLPPSSAMISEGMPAVTNEMLPAPQPHERPFPYQNVPSGTLSNRPDNQPQPSVYPVLPPAPTSRRGEKIPARSGRPAQKAGSQTRPGRSLFPVFVGMFFVAVQLLLLVRFVLKLLALLGTTTWISLIYTTSDIFVLPFRLIMQNFTLPIPDGLELYTLIAILFYGLLSRLLVRFLKALLHSR